MDRLAVAQVSDWIGESLEQYRLNWQLMAAGAPSGRIFETDSLHFAMAGLKIPLFNAAFLKRPAASAAEAGKWGAEAVEQFVRAGVPGVLSAPASWLPRGSELQLEKAGLRRAHSFMGMRTARLNDPAEPPQAIDLRELPHEDASEVVARVNGSAYGLAADEWRQMLIPGFWKPPVRAYAVFEGGRPVSVGAAATANRISYLMWMATEPAAQRRGYAEAIVRRAWEDARTKDGAKFTVLHATAMGRPLYARLGYLAVAEFPSFGWGGT